MANRGNALKLFLFEKSEESLGKANAILTKYYDLPPGTLEKLDFDGWVEIFIDAPFSHPLKEKSIEMIGKLAHSLAQEKTYFFYLGVYHAQKKHHGD